MENQQVDCGCDQVQQPLLSTTQALDFLTASAQPMSRYHSLSLDEALGRILAKDICASINVPGFDNSAMDGYAIHLQQDQIDTPGGLTFEITDRIAAGHSGKDLAPGCAARIFTGAPIPNGANTVIMQEECELTGNDNRIEIYRPISLGENIRPLGNDICSGEVILQAGKKLKPQDIALAASVGVNTLEVFERLKVGVFFTGDELVEPGNPLQNGQIYNSNRYSLVAALRTLDCEVVNLGNIEDTLSATTQALNELQNQCDLIMTTGGVSVGEEDHVKPAVEQLGELNLWRIRMKPGKPLAFGTVGNTPFIGLPGNPVSAMVTFLLFARVFIKKSQGNAQYHNVPFKVKTDFAWHRPKPRREFVRAQLSTDEITPIAKQYPKQGSEVLSSMVWADGLVEIPEKSTFEAGQVLNFYLLDEMLS